MPGFDFDRAVRWARVDRGKALLRRHDDELPFLDTAEAGPSLLLDTSVYIDQLQGRLPPAIEQLIAVRQSNHSAIALQELLHSVGALDPTDKRTPSVIRQIGAVVRSMPSHRLHVPDADILGRAAILSGILSRRQGYAKGDGQRSLHDCVLFLQARQLGLLVVTRNIRDFDLLLQLVPSGRVAFYRTGPA